MHDSFSSSGDVRAELNRGATFGRTLSRPLRALLDSLVGTGPVREEDVLVTGRALDPFRGVRTRRRVNRLVAMRFIRRDEGYLRPSIAGIGAARPRATPRDVQLYAPVMEPSDGARNVPSTGGARALRPVSSVRSPG